MENIGMNDMYNILVKIQDNVIDLHKDMKDMQKNMYVMQNDISGMKNDIHNLDKKIDNVRDELNAKIDNVKDELKGDISSLAEETAQLVVGDVVPYLEKEYSKLDLRVTNLENFAMKHGYTLVKS